MTAQAMRSQQAETRLAESQTAQQHASIRKLESVQHIIEQLPAADARPKQSMNNVVATGLPTTLLSCIQHVAWQSGG